MNLIESKIEIYYFQWEPIHIKLVKPNAKDFHRIYANLVKRNQFINNFTKFIEEFYISNFSFILKFSPDNTGNLLKFSTQWHSD